MNPQSIQSLYFFRLLVNKYFTGRADLVAKLLPKEQVEALARYQTPLKTPEVLLFNADRWFKTADLSWFLPTIQTFDAPLQRLYGEIIPTQMRTALGITGENSQKPLSEPVKQFLLSYLHSKWPEAEPLPKELIQTGELLPLLDLSKSELLEIIDLLSMHDLIDEVRHIVDKRVLQTISSLLTLPQQQYLRTCLRQKTKPHAPSFTLRELLKEPKKFPALLHKTGLKRFALALNGESKEFMWHIMHTLDVSRAAFLKQEVQSVATPHASKLAQLEILQILQFLKVGSKP
jgi:hypothetical protein